MMIINKVISLQWCITDFLEEKGVIFTKIYVFKVYKYELLYTFWITEKDGLNHELNLKFTFISTLIANQMS